MAGIVTYGAYIPKYRIKIDEIAKMWGKRGDDIRASLNIEEKSVPDVDEDTATIAVEAARNALRRVLLDVSKIGAIYVGSESHPYAVKPTATIVAEGISASPNLTSADLEFACKAATAGIQACMGLVESSNIRYGLAIGADVAQASPGDQLEYTAGAGGAAFVLGADDLMVEIEDFFSYTTDTPDFWRRNLHEYPEHGGRFTGEPAYFKHVIAATEGLLNKLGKEPSDYNFFVPHQPNGKFPLKVAKRIGFNQKQVEPSLIVKKIGNTYSASSILGLAAVLDIAHPDERILMTSYGSGAGADCFSMRTTERIEEREGASTIKSLLERPRYIDYALYSKMMGKF
jgi:hydroxymethylglutaryl-CoA synthase